MGESPLDKLWLRIEEELLLISNERDAAGLPSLGLLEVLLLGQLSLFFDAAAKENLQLWATQDLDAHIKGDWLACRVFKKACEEIGFKYDELSSEIWIPPEAKYRTLHQSPLLNVTSPEAIYILLSKAVKAREKNRDLVFSGLIYYGDPFAKLLRKYKVDLDYFLEGR